MEVKRKVDLREGLSDDIVKLQGGSVRRLGLPRQVDSLRMGTFYPSLERCEQDLIAHLTRSSRSSHESHIARNAGRRQRVCCYVQDAASNCTVHHSVSSSKYVCANKTFIRLCFLMCVHQRICIFYLHGIFFCDSTFFLGASSVRVDFFLCEVGHPYMFSTIYAHMYMLYAHMHAYILPYTHNTHTHTQNVLIDVDSFIHTYKVTYVHTYIHTYTQTCTRTYTHAYLPACMHAHRTHKRTRTTHTHSLTRTLNKHTHTRAVE